MLYRSTSSLCCGWSITVINMQFEVHGFQNMVCIVTQAVSNDDLVFYDIKLNWCHIFIAHFVMFELLNSAIFTYHWKSCTTGSNFVPLYNSVICIPLEQFYLRDQFSPCIMQCNLYTTCQAKENLSLLILRP